MAANGGAHALHPFERLTARLGGALLLALLLTPLALLVPDSDDPTFLLRASTAQLSAAMLFALLASLWAVRPAFERWDGGSPWFPSLAEPYRILATATVHVAAVSGVTLLVVLAWGAALRFDPSLQYLQIISALDIVWGLTVVVSLTPVLLRRQTRSVADTVAASLGAGYIAFCQFPLIRYLANVGFTPEGGWKVDGAAMWEYILPYDMAAAAFALAIATATAYSLRRAATASRADAAERARGAASG